MAFSCLMEAGSGHVFQDNDESTTKGRKKRRKAATRKVNHEWTRICTNKRCESSWTSL